MFLLRHPQHALGADGDGRRPSLHTGFGAGQDVDMGTSRERCLPIPLRRRQVEHHGRSRRPCLAADWMTATRVHHPHAYGCRDTVQLPAQFRICEHGQHAATA
jgi:hypothetical protein